MWLIDADALKTEMVNELANTMRMTEMHKGDMALRVLNKIDEAPAVDAIPIDTVAEMLADLFGDEIPCNYNDIYEMLPIGCEKAQCPDDGDHSCWKKYVMHWLKRKVDGGAK